MELGGALTVDGYALVVIFRMSLSWEKSELNNVQDLVNKYHYGGYKMFTIMRYLFIVILLIPLACSKPQDIVFGPEPLKTLAEKGKLFMKLPEEERTLLVSYLSLSEMGKALGGNIKPATGRTVREVLVDAHKWQDEIRAAEAEKKKKEAEQKIIVDKILSSVNVSITDKKVLIKDYKAGRYQDMLILAFAVENKSEKTIIQLKGLAIFKDATGDKIGDLPVDFDDPINAGDRIETTTGRGWNIQQFINRDIEKIATREFHSMVTHFEPKSIAFADGEILKIP